jgi:hypothetical protein
VGYRFVYCIGDGLLRPSVNSLRTATSSFDISLPSNHRGTAFGDVCQHPHAYSPLAQDPGITQLTCRQVLTTLLILDSCLHHAIIKASPMAQTARGKRMQFHQKRSWQRPFELLGWSSRLALESSFPFFKLPTELRFDVLRYLLMSEDPDGYVTASALRTLRHASHQLAREAEDIYWSENVFRFRRHDAGADSRHCYFGKWLRDIPKDCVMKVRQISIRSPTRVTLFGPYHGHDYALASSTIVYNLDLTAINSERSVSICYSPSHRGILGNYPYVASWLDLSRVAHALFLVSGQIRVTKRALMAFHIASSMQRSSAIFNDILHEGDQERRSRIIASLVSCSPSIGEYEDGW